MTFDIPTAMQLTATMTLIMGTGLAFCVRGYPPALQYPIRLWVRGLLLQPLPYMLLALHGHVSMLFSVVVANTFLALAYMHQMQALREFNQRPQRRAQLGLLLLTLVIAELLLTYVWPNPSLRVMASSLVLAITASYGVVAIYQKRSQLTRAEHMLAGLLIVGIGIMLMRIMLPAQTRLDSLSQSSVLAGIVFTYAALLPVIATTGFVLMCGERLNEDLGRLATLDPLTGACNRRTLSTLAEQALSTARRQQRPLALLLLDIDHFKHVNDEFGHEAGDSALCAVVELIRGSLRTEDVISRIGGEEFAIMLPDCTEAAGMVMAERLRENVAGAGLVLAGWPVSLSVSIGVSALTGEITDLASLLRQADHALYGAKRGGRNRVMAASQVKSMPAAAQH